MVEWITHIYTIKLRATKPHSSLNQRCWFVYANLEQCPSMHTMLEVPCVCTCRYRYTHTEWFKNDYPKLVCDEG
jgi:hypothetical protein